MNSENNEIIPVMLVDDEPQILLSYSVMLKSEGIGPVASFDDSRRVIPFLREHPVSLAVLDLSMPFVNGRDLLKQIGDEFPRTQVIIVTAMNDIDTAVACMREGAVDYLVKPVEKNRFISSIHRALEISQLKNQVDSLRSCFFSDQLHNPDAFRGIVTVSPKLRAIFKYIEAIAVSPFPVLIQGETGSGKELIARSIHRAGRYSGAFVAVNAAGLDDQMFSDTLFGHQRGAFTGADTQRPGLISQASNGVIFLDEIADLSHPSQVKLLRLIQEKEYFPLGADLPKRSNARIVVAVNQMLTRLVDEGRFRKDLYFRLSAHEIDLPPLRERPEDLPDLLDHFIAQAAAAMGKKKVSYPPELIDLLETYHFPGNVRELEAMVYDALSRHESGIMSMDSFKRIIGVGRERRGDRRMESEVQEKDDTVTRFFSNFPTLKEAEQFLIEEALKRAKGNQSITASMLGISRQALNKRLQRQKAVEES